MSIDAIRRGMILEYEWLRQLAKALDGQANYVDARLIEIESQLPDSYQFVDDEIARRQMGGSSIIAAEEAIRSTMSLEPKKGGRPAAIGDHFELDERR